MSIIGYSNHLIDIRSECRQYHLDKVDALVLLV